MVIIWLMMVNNKLVGSFNHLENCTLSSQWEGGQPIYEMDNKKCSKPPTSHALFRLVSKSNESTKYNVHSLSKKVLKTSMTSTTDCAGNQGLPFPPKQ